MEGPKDGFKDETIRQWCLKFGPDYTRAFKRRQGRLGDTGTWMRCSSLSRVNDSISGVPSSRMTT